MIYKLVVFDGYDKLISWKVMNHSGKVVTAANAPNAAPYEELLL